MQQLQETHYFLEPKRRKVAPSVFGHGLPTTPFPRLFGGQETPENNARRYALYQKVWAAQHTKIQHILNHTNTALFEQLMRYLGERRRDVSKLRVGFISLTSNTANNLRILDEFNHHFTAHGGSTHLVNLNSKHCANVKSMFREVVHQFVGTAEDRVSYDFDAVEEWYATQPSTELVVLVQDTDSVNVEVLNHLVRLLCGYNKRLPLTLLLGLLSGNVGSWINANLSNSLRTKIDGVKFSANDNVDLGYKVLGELFLNHTITEDAPIALDARLSTIVLNRFENSNNSIDSLIASLKLSYMIYFYLLPLSVLADASFVPSGMYVDALRKLPSFKKLIEFKLYEHKKEKCLADEIRRLLEEDDAVVSTYFRARADFAEYQNCVINAVNLLSQIDPARKHYFEIYKLISNNQLVNSVYLSEALRHAKGLSEERQMEVITFIKSNPHLTDDPHVEKLRSSVKLGNLLQPLNAYFNENPHLNKTINDNLFNEVLTFNGGVSEFDTVTPPRVVEEDLDNLMINLVRPSLRRVIEQGLDEPETYLGTPLVGPDSDLAPMLSKLYNVYKDAPVTINIYDFYVAFRLSLSKKAILTELQRGLAPTSVIDSLDALWDKVTFAWFLQSCFELLSFGFMKEKMKGDFLEKAVWKGI